MRRRILQSSDEDLLDEPLVNLTPLIDVVFVVLIVFILISPALDVDSILLAPSRLIDQKEFLPMQESALSISIRSDDSVWLLGKQVNLSELEKYLLLEKKRRPLEVPLLIPDARAHFETYQQVKNLVEACGFSQMDLILRSS